MTNLTDSVVDECVRLYRGLHHEFEVWTTSIVETFRLAPELTKLPLPIIHSIKSRVKDEEHLRDKLLRKRSKGELIEPERLFSSVTDLSGVRVLHLYQGQFSEIHAKVISKVNSGDWVLGEKPVAYSWDPDLTPVYEKLGIRVDIKPSNYTSVHYLIRSPNPRSCVCCELQVRTLFEEVWGEIDHTVNYPYATDSVACKEQLRVLARLVSAGTRLADAIFTTMKDFEQNRPKSS